MKRSIVIFCGPGRAGSTFVQKLLDSNRNYLFKNKIYLPIIKETYIGTLKEISSKDLKKLYNLNQSELATLGLMENPQKFDYTPSRVMTNYEQEQYEKTRQAQKALLEKRIEKGEISPDTNLNFILDDTARPSPNSMTLQEYAKSFGDLYPNIATESEILKGGANITGMLNNRQTIPNAHYFTAMPPEAVDGAIKMAYKY